MNSNEQQVQGTAGNNNDQSNTQVNQQPRVNTQGARRQFRSTSQDTPKWQAARDAMTAGTAVDVTVTGVAIKENRPRGLNVTLNGLVAFIPGSELPKGTDQKALVGATIAVKVIEVNRRKGVLKASRSQVVADEQKAFFAKLESENITTVEGTVERKTDFGWFVNLGCVDGLVHISNAPKEGLTIGEKVTARIVRLNAEEGKIGLSMREDAPQGRGRSGGRNDGGNYSGGNNGGGRGTHGNAAAFNARYERRSKPTPTVTVSSKPATPAKPKAPRQLQTGRRDGFEVSFSNFADLAAHFAAKEAATSADATPAPTDAAAPTAE